MYVTIKIVTHLASPLKLDFEYFEYKSESVIQSFEDLSWIKALQEFHDNKLIFDSSMIERKLIHWFVNTCSFGIESGGWGGVTSSAKMYRKLCELTYQLYTCGPCGPSCDERSALRGSKMTPNPIHSGEAIASMLFKSPFYTMQGEPTGKSFTVDLTKKTFTIHKMVEQTESITLELVS